MSFRAYWSARLLLWEERFGPSFRESENKRRAEEDQLAAAYQRTVAALKRESDGPG